MAGELPCGYQWTGWPDVLGNVLVSSVRAQLGWEGLPLIDASPSRRADDKREFVLALGTAIPKSRAVAELKEYRERHNPASGPQLCASLAYQRHGRSAGLAPKCSGLANPPFPRSLYQLGRCIGSTCSYARLRLSVGAVRFVANQLFSRSESVGFERGGEVEGSLLGVGALSFMPFGSRTRLCERSHEVRTKKPTNTPPRSAVSLATALCRRPQQPDLTVRRLSSGRSSRSLWRSEVESRSVAPAPSHPRSVSSQPFVMSRHTYLTSRVSHPPSMILPFGGFPGQRWAFRTNKIYHDLRRI